MQGKPHEQPPLYTSTLADKLGFSETDLAMNRQGRISQAQKQHLQAKLKAGSDELWLTLMILLGVTLLLSWIVASQGIPMITLLIGGGAVLIPFIWLIYQRQIKLRQDIDSTHVRQVRGWIEWLGNGKLETSPAKLIIDNQRFEVPAAAYRDLIDYATAYCAVYYSETSRQILSMEVLPEPDEEKRKVEELGDKRKVEELALDEDSLTDEAVNRFDIPDSHYDDKQSRS